MWECVNSNLSQTSQAGGTKGDQQPECGSAGEKGRDSPLSWVITFCRQGSSASRPEGPSRGGCSVLFQCILPPFTSHPLVFDVVGLPGTGCVVPLGEGLLPSCSSTQCLQMNHHLLTTWVVLQGPKPALIRAVTLSQLSLLTEQVLLHTLGRICKSFILQSSVTDPVLQFLLSLGLWGAHLL